MAEKKMSMSTVHRGRKNLAYLQKMKDKGEKIVQMCPAELGPVFGLAAEMVGCDILRTPGLLTMRTGPDQNHDQVISRLSIMKYREYVQNIHINFYLPISLYADKVDAVKYGAEIVFAGADSILAMGVTNETLKYMSDNYVPTYGHIGAVSGWQTNATGYAKVGRTAEDAFRIFKWGYEY